MFAPISACSEVDGHRTGSFDLIFDRNPIDRPSDRLYHETMIEFERVTTRGGDKGESSLFNGERRVKDDAIFEALGDIDELVSWLGLVKADVFASPVSGLSALSSQLHEIQNILMRFSGQIATPKKDKLYEKISHLSQRDLETLEASEAVLLKKTNIGSAFVVPGQTHLSAEIDIARTVCRRAERRVVTCIRSSYLGHLALGQNYLNRLSDFLFVLARWVEQAG